MDATNTKNSTETMKAKRARTEWTRIAGEEVRVEEIGGALYGFCSELASLRLFLAYNKVSRCEHSRCGFSQNLGTHYFSLEF